MHSGRTDNLYYNGNLTTSGELPADGLYSVDNPETYLYTTNISNGCTDHPNDIDSKSLSLVDGSFTRHTDTLINALIYDFTGLNLQLTDSFAFAYAPWCANDIIIETYTADPVPEPATMLLFGSGLLGLAGLRRKIK